MAIEAATPSDLTARILLALGSSLSVPDDWPVEALRGDVDLSSFTSLAQQHGLGAALLPQHLPLDRLPGDVRATWKRLAMVQFAQNAARFARLEELAVELDCARIPTLLFKGGAAMLWAYGDRDRRDLGDFDLLIHAEHVEPARESMARLGYREVNAYSSAEEEHLGIARVHLPPFVHPDGTVVELHVNVLERRGNRAVATPEIWRDAVPEELAGSPVWRMSWEHFLLQTAVHYTRHLEEDRAPLKGLADMLAVVRQFGPQLNWPELWRAAGRWGITAPVARVFRTLEVHWALSIPGLPPGSAAVSLAELVSGSCPDLAGPASRGRERVAAARELPTLAARCRYLFRLVFPTPEHLRWRYRLSEGVNVAPYYLRYPLDRIRGQFKGSKE